MKKWPEFVDTRLPKKKKLHRAIRRCVMVRSPLHGEIFAVYGYNIVAFNNNVVITHIHMGTIYTFMATKYICIVTNRYVC